MSRNALSHVGTRCYQREFWNLEFFIRFRSMLAIMYLVLLSTSSSSSLSLKLSSLCATNTSCNLDSVVIYKLYFLRNDDWLIIYIGNLFDMNKWVVFKFSSKVRPESWANASFSPGVCGYMCPTRWAMWSRLWPFWCPCCCPGKCPWCSWRCWQKKKNFLPSRSRIRVTPRFFEYKVRLDNIYNFQNLCAQF